MDKFELITKLYTNIFNLTKEISTLIQEDSLDFIDSKLKIRQELIIKANELKENINFNEEQKKILNELVAKTRQLEEKNISDFETKRNNLKKNISSVGKNRRAISAYKTTKKQDPKLFDYKNQ